MSAIKKHMEIGREYYLERADRDIEKYRKGNFTINVLFLMAIYEEFQYPIIWINNGI